MYDCDTAQICLNGHIVNGAIHHHPEDNRKYCPKCGAVTIIQCTSCITDIPGTNYVWPVLFIETPPNFCGSCSNPFPWTEAILKAAQDLTEELDKLSDQEKELLKKSIDDIVRDTPAAAVGIVGYKKLIVKAGQGVAEAFRSILVDVLSEAMKKQMGM